MKKENFLLFIIPIILLLFGIFSWYYFGIYRTNLAVTSCKIEKALIPWSPIVTFSKFDKKNNQLIIDVENPSGMPISLLTKSLVLQPQDKTKQPIALMLEIPLWIDIPPYGKINVKLDLGQAGSWFVKWDVLITTLTYKLPVSNDIYSVVHLFKHSWETENGYISNQLESNNQVKQNYENKIKNNKK